MRKLFLFLLIAIPSFLMAQHQSLFITFSDIQSNKGMVKIALFSGEDNYKIYKPYRTTSIAIENQNAVWVIDSVPAGEYIITAFHDENNNDNLDLGQMGIPTEGYAFSNNAQPEMGPPDAKKMLFTIHKNEKAKQNLKMIYFDFSTFQ